MESNTPRVGPGIAKVSIRRVDGAGSRNCEDQVAVEEPLEIRLEYGADPARAKRSLSITMRTPGQDAELAAGFLFTEGLIRSGKDVASVRAQGNTVEVSLAPTVSIELGKLTRHFYTSSSCGVCGKSSIDALRVQSQFTPDEFSVLPQTVHGLPARLRDAQGVFDATGGIHGSALFDLEGRLLALREDVGRHNALDKLIGHFLFEDRLPLRRSILLVSGRASFELVQKAAMAGVGVLAAVGAPSSLAAGLAEGAGMTLLGFVRNERFNVYTHPSRIVARVGELA